MTVGYRTSKHPDMDIPMDESQFKTLRELARDGTLSQRDLSRKMGLSLGRVNYLVNELVKNGYIRARRFKNSRNKMGYRYIITPKGIRTKIAQTYGFLGRKIDEFERLRQEIEVLKREAGGGLDGARGRSSQCGIFYE